MDSTTMACDGLKTLQLDGVKVTWIQDNAKERLMERTLFADASDELIDSLKLADLQVVDGGSHGYEARLYLAIRHDRTNRSPRRREIHRQHQRRIAVYCRGWPLWE